MSSSVVAFRAVCPPGQQGSTAKVTGPDGRQYEVPVPAEAVGGEAFDVPASALPFRWTFHGLPDPVARLPASGPLVRVCAECAARRHSRAISRAARAPLCTQCEASYDASAEEEEEAEEDETPAPPGEGHRRGRGARPVGVGWRSCPRCQGSVSTAGYSWAHHMRLCDPKYFQDEIASTAPILKQRDGGSGGGGGQTSEISFLRPADYSDIQ